MKISSITLRNFRCFGDKPTTIDLCESEITAFIGSNAAGKTAALQALMKLFGVGGTRNRLQKDDFHFTQGQELLPSSIELLLEVIIVFPELMSDQQLITVPECWNHMVVSEGDATPFCRVRLEATWTPGDVPEGVIQEDIYWITTAGAEVGKDHKQIMREAERRKIQVLYVPATREPANQLRNIAGTMLARVLRAVNWSAASREAMNHAAEQVQSALSGEAGIQVFHEAIQGNWKVLHDAQQYTDPRLSFLGNGTDEVFKQVGMIFSPSESGSNHTIDRLSDGQKSLFYLALVATMCDIERHAMTMEPAVLSDDTDEAEYTDIPERPLSSERLSPPLLSILAIEEPENHLAPHYLSRVAVLLKSMALKTNTQVIITSHSPSILKRVEPKCIRFFRHSQASGISSVRSIRLPEQADEAFKYIKEAVQAYPELYFARLVVLGEGDSEEIVIPRVAASHGVVADTSFVSIVPLGGRYVNHFWRLLTDLEIPYITLLDLDRERHGGGWGRVKYALTQLLDLGIDSTALRVVPLDDGTTETVSLEYLEIMHKRDPKIIGNMQAFLNHLETWNVFFSQPLDLDLMMLKAHPEAYKTVATVGDGPSALQQDEPKRTVQLAADLRSVLGSKGSDGQTYTNDWTDLFPWYAYLFLRKGKPSTHLLALMSVKEKDMKDKCPAVLERLVNRMASMLGTMELKENA